MWANLQGSYALPKTENYFDLIQGDDYHTQPLTFHEFLSRPESMFLYEDAFMQIPGYIQAGAQIKPIEEPARQFVARYIMEEFEHNLLGMQNYQLWAKKFEHKCAAIAPSFWAQVNMHDLMMAYELETDETSTTRANAATTSRTGENYTKSDNQSVSYTKGKTTTDQDIDNTQKTDASTREATTTVVRAEGQLTADVEYNWGDAADNVHEIRSRAGDTNQHMHSETNSESGTEAASQGTTTTGMTNDQGSNVNIGKDASEYTNKMFMQEKQWAINTARDLFPLEWLRAQLRPMFSLLY